MKDPCKRFSYIGSDGKPVYKDKVKYNTKAEAKQRADEMNGEYRVIHQLSVYLCPKCHKWHIGRSSVESVRREGYFSQI